MTRMHKLYRHSVTTGKCEDCGLIDNHSNACHDAAPIRKIEDLYDQLEGAERRNDAMRKALKEIMQLVETPRKVGWTAEGTIYLVAKEALSEKPLYDPATDETLKKVDAGIQAIKDLSTNKQKCEHPQSHWSRPPGALLTCGVCGEVLEKKVTR